MPDLLLELLSEEIPARMQRRAAEDLKALVTNALVDRGLVYEGAKAFATPRRLALTVAGLPVKARDTREERKGPRVGAPDAAVQGFLKSAGLSDISQAKIEKDPKKGEFYVAVIEKKGQATADAIAEIIPGIIRNFPWPKSMRWGAASAPVGTPYSPPDAKGAEALRWVRPLQSILCTFGPETEDPDVIHFEIDGLKSGDRTRGHRFLAPAEFRVKRFEDYVAKLEKAFVVLDADRRKDIIATDARNLAHAQNLELIEDEGLLEEVAGLVEWPVVLMGDFDESFLDTPAEVIRATIRANQKCFVLKAPHPAGAEAPSTLSPQAGRGKAAANPGLDPGETSRGDGKLANKFLLTSNMAASDGGKTIIAGNGRVIRARLSDALYFWTTDRGALPDVKDYADAAQKLSLDLEKPLDQRMAKLAHLNVVFHEKLGTQGERVARIRALARELAPIVGADPDLAARAAVLAKADLMTEVVGEFPEVQGLMGRRYAELQGEHPSVCAAIEEHYKPQGPNDRVPTDPVSVAVALADKLDTLVGFWAIDEKPTGSKDPYALRRAALGVIRLVVENEIRVRQLVAVNRAQQPLHKHLHGKTTRFNISSVGSISDPHDVPFDTELGRDLLSFFHDRLKVLLREQGARHDLVDAVLSDASPSPREAEGRAGVGGGATASPSQASSHSPHPQSLPAASGGREAPAATIDASNANDDLLLIVRRVAALGTFLDSEDGKNLLAGWRRAANILRAEEKKDGEGAFNGDPDPALLQADEEKALHQALSVALPQAESAVAQEDFAGAMRALSQLRAPVDAFFDKVIVNADDPALRANRLKLLNQLRAATRAVADFSKITG